MIKLVWGVGVNDRKYPTKVNGKHTKRYDVWRHILSRCYSPKYQKEHPTYIGCSASENFKNYSYFYEWCQSQIGFGQEGFQIDKDLIFRGNKVYSEDTCLFLPRELNSLLVTRGADRGNLHVGVCAYRGGKFMAQCSRKHSFRCIGYFNTPNEAYQAYKEAKESYMKLQAKRWKALIDPRAYEALMRYEVLPTD